MEYYGRQALCEPLAHASSLLHQTLGGQSRQVYSCWPILRKRGLRLLAAKGPAGEEGPGPALPSWPAWGRARSPHLALGPAVLSDRSDPAQHVIPVLSLKEIFTEVSGGQPGTCLLLVSL